MPINDPTPSPSDDVTLIPPDESVDLPNPTDDIDADDTAVINAQAAIEKDTIDWSEGFRKFQNYEVAAYFEKVSDDSLPMQSQKDYWMKLCIITEDDGLLKAIGKYQLFDRVRGADFSKLNEVYLLPPSEAANIDLRGTPKLKLYFVETNYLTDSNRDIADGQIAGIRLVEFSAETIKKTDAIALGEKVRDAFKGFIWQKGKSNLSYSDPKKGYNLQILCDTKEGGIEVLTKVLSLREHEVENKRINFSGNDSPEEAYPETLEEIKRLEKTVKKRVKRPICTVKLRAAFLYVDGLIKPEVLYDNSGYYPSPYVTDEV
ncbi:hypothetical protein [Pseudanabaena sp. 'Roaring Creek']|uniref:hypothetical protein n=1 Tax=Pseudanabaena sp. 'Roaring Creek' TaxID=1681830 RepID=UPI0006D7FBB2|nr:hypothetical protein [Pseudanabaena sp. 'Roaring Creek']